LPIRSSLSTGSKGLEKEPYRSSGKVVAGARYHLNLLFNAFRLEPA
jgi:hypothetical protein